MLVDQRISTLVIESSNPRTDGGINSHFRYREKVETILSHSGPIFFSSYETGYGRGYSTKSLTRKKCLHVGILKIPLKVPSGKRLQFANLKMAIVK